MFWITLIVFIVIFSALVLIHEWGHFTMARRAGMKVEEFGIGLPPRAKTIYKDKKGTIYSFNWIPFGGFVRLHGEDSSDPKALKDPDSYASKSVLRRVSVVIAGVVMNFLLAWVLITIGFMIGMKPFLVTQEDVTSAINSGILTTEQVLTITEVNPDSSLAGILPDGEGIILKEINGQPIGSSQELLEILEPNQTFSLTIADADGQSQVDATTNDEGLLGLTLSQGYQVLELQKTQYPFYKAPFMAAKEVGRLSVLTVSMLGDVVVHIVQKFAVPEGVAGPVGIFTATQEILLQRSLTDLIQFTALLSVSLAVLNIMPFPALDGGRLLFILVEVVTRRRVNAKWEAVIHAVGFIFLITLILFITWNDIIKIF